MHSVHLKHGWSMLTLCSMLTRRRRHAAQGPRHLAPLGHRQRQRPALAAAQDHAEVRCAVAWHGTCGVTASRCVSLPPPPPPPFHCSCRAACNPNCRRACELLRVGGRLVYSTCTFNPVEDEAVVAEVRSVHACAQLRLLCVFCAVWSASHAALVAPA